MANRRKELEMLIIGAIIKGYAEGVYKLIAEDFSDQDARSVFVRIALRIVNQVKVDQNMSLDPDLPPSEAMYIESAVDYAESVGVQDIEEKIESLVKFSDLQFAYMGCRNLSKDISERKVEDPSEVAVSLELLISQLTTRHNSTITRTAGESALSALKGAERMKKRKRLPFGIKGVDDFLNGGIRRGEFVVVGARTNVGKSIISMMPALSCARMNEPVLFCSNEMSADDMALRMLSHIAQVDVRVIDGTFQGSSVEHDAITDAIKEMQKLKIYFYENCTRLSQIETALSMRRASGVPVSMVVLDHINRMEDDVGKNRKKIEYMPEISHRIAQLAKTYECTFVVMVQINRAGTMAARIGAEHLKDCGDLEQDADKIFLMWGDRGRKDGRHLYLEKNRSGQKDMDFSLILHGNRMMFEEVDRL